MAISISLHTKAADTWTSIVVASRTEQPSLYLQWCREIVATQALGSLTIQEAARLITWPESLSRVEGLEEIADLYLILEYSWSLEEGSLYDGDEPSQRKDWQYVKRLIERHSEID